jgi:poly-gamma-glutamate capsule biosynthesis protein CapA/YwtB (metallophosphatase superfamily)
MEKVSLIIGADLAPTPLNFSLFAEGNIEALIDEKLTSLLDSVDYRIFNLEIPITDEKKPISKEGPNFFAPISTMKGIGLLRPTILGLANNHILDQDEQGLFQTMEQLSKNNIRFVGAGIDLLNASKPVIIEKGVLKIAVYACAENEFSIATENRAGANPFDPLESLDHIANIKSLYDYVIVLYHGGKEHYRYPSPYLQKVCRKMAEKGADLVICQHSHCIGTYEEYQNSVIIYGQGNFIFDKQNNEFWNTSLLIKAEFGDKMSIDFVPICRQGKRVQGIPPLPGL